jgi:hypothetical protein
MRFTLFGDVGDVIIAVSEPVDVKQVLVSQKLCKYQSRTYHMWRCHWVCSIGVGCG